MRRCTETAEILYPALCGQNLGLIEDFREYCFGNYEGKSHEELLELPGYQEWLDSGGELTFPGGEDPAAFQARNVAAFGALVRELFEEDLPAGAKEMSAAVIVHGGTIQSILSDLTGKGFYECGVKNGGGFALSLSRDETQKSGFSILRMEELAVSL